MERPETQDKICLFCWCRRKHGTKARRSWKQTSSTSHYCKRNEFHNSLQSCAQIHSDTSNNENSRCKGSSGKGTGKKLKKIPARQLTKVWNKREVINDARNKVEKFILRCWRYQNYQHDVRCDVGENVDDCWNVDGDRELSDTWTGFTRFTILDEKPLDGPTWFGGRLTRKQTTSRPDSLWPEIWKDMSQALKRREMQKWAFENLKLDASSNENTWCSSGSGQVMGETWKDTGMAAWRESETKKRWLPKQGMSLEKCTLHR